MSFGLAVGLAIALPLIILFLWFWGIGIAALLIYILPVAVIIWLIAFTVENGEAVSAVAGTVAIFLFLFAAVVKFQEWKASAPHGKGECPKCGKRVPISRLGYVQSHTYRPEFDKSRPRSCPGTNRRVVTPPPGE